MSTGKHNQPHNPHHAAAGAYGMNAQKGSTNPRELEARVLLKSAQFLQDLQNGWDQTTGEDREDVLKYNRTIWMMFYDTALENAEGTYPEDLRANILNLSNFIFKREIEILAKPSKEKLDILININRNIAAGLMKGAHVEGAAAPDSSDSGTPPNSPSGSTITSA